MSFALNINDEGRILSATFPEFATKDAIIVETLPDGDISDYRYVDGEFVYDALPKTEEISIKSNSELEAENELLKAQVSALSEQMDFYEECIVEMATVVYA